MLAYAAMQKKVKACSERDRKVAMRKCYHDLIGMQFVIGKLF